jgi:adenine-specific DNA-methyltransferase
LPRLRLLKEFLSEDGCIIISIDDVELANLRLLCDDIFSKQNFVATICWQKIYTVKNSARHISGMHDYLAIYAKKKSTWSRNLRPRDSDTDVNYSNPDGDRRGEWISHALQSRNFYSKGTYTIQCPGGRIIDGPPDGTYWRVEEKKFWELHEDGRVWWGSNGNNAPRIKEFLEEAKEGVVPVSWWTYKFAGTNSGAKTQLRDMMGGEGFFDTPKPIELIERILDLATDNTSIVLDAFAGSGTTGHAVLRKNSVDGGTRQFILIETIVEIAQNVTSRRLTRAIEGYDSTRKEDFVIRQATITPALIRRGSEIYDEFNSIGEENKSKFDKLRIETQEDRLVLVEIRAY